jgi:hypothetical protein
VPVELRKILFAEEELQAAVIDYCLRSKIRLPEASIDSIDITDDAEACVVLNFDTDHTDDVRDVKLSRDQVAASLIRYCGEHKIPLPRKARKILQPGDEGVALLINIRWERRAKGKSSAAAQ